MIDASAEARRRLDLPEWSARLAVAAVFALNLDCAFAFVFQPAKYLGAFELSGVPGESALRGLGIAFLMWNATYPLVIWAPGKHLTVFGVVLAQQTIGLLGETWLLLGLPAGHEALSAAMARFLAFDGAGLGVMAAAYALLAASRHRRVYHDSSLAR